MIDVTDPNTKKTAFAGKNIEWSDIPATGDVYDFKTFWAYHDGQNWFVVCWSGRTALAAQRQLVQLTRDTAKRLEH